MDKIAHPNANTRLRHPDFEDGTRDLVVERLTVQDTDSNEIQTALESAWQPTEDELRALANGAPVLLCVVGQHPPVSLHVGEPATDHAPTYLASHVERALGHLHAQLTDRGTFGAVPAPDTFLRFWKEALQATITPPGDGPSIIDYAPDTPPDTPDVEHGD